MLELKLYKIKELQNILGVSTTGIVLKRLGEMGYDFNYIKYKGVEITSLPQQDSLNRIKEIVITKFHKTSSFNVEGFSCLLFKFLTDEKFWSMPWETRSKVIENEFGIYISERTLREWGKMLIENDILQKREQKEIWRTYEDKDGVRYQEQIVTELQLKDYEIYKLKRSIRQERNFNALSELHPSWNEKFLWRKAFVITNIEIWKQSKEIYYKKIIWRINENLTEDIKTLCNLIDTLLK